MQPLAYFAARSLLGWLQFLERADRAFVSSALLLVATGAAHSWAVVYALFIAIHTRAMRFDGYHEGYREHLPFWVSWTEMLAVLAMAVWWVAGFIIAAVRLADDDADGLPMERRDMSLGTVVRLMRSPMLRSLLAAAHTLSCVGLFLSVILLCLAMALMKGGITACELCLCCVSLAFALPHAALAFRRLEVLGCKECVELPSLPAAAAAQEAAALGPQLCVVLALADSPDHAYLWQNTVYVLTTGLFVAAVLACGRAPPKAERTALPPEPAEGFACLALNVAASVALVICFPHLNTWHLWVFFVVLLGLFAVLWAEGWREVVVDLLDPLLVVRSDTDKALPGRWRQRLRGISWVATLLCAAVALWDVILHPVQEGLFEPAGGAAADDGLPELWDQSAVLMLRWQEGAGSPGEPTLLRAAALALGLPSDAVAPQAFATDHRLLVFRVVEMYRNAHVGRTLHLEWQSAVAAPEGALASLVDPSFPHALNVTLCLHAHADQQAEESEAPREQLAALAEAAGPAPGAPEAYLHACGWWTSALDAYYQHGHVHEGEAAMQAAGEQLQQLSQRLEREGGA